MGRQREETRHCGGSKSMTSCRVGFLHTCMIQVCIRKVCYVAFFFFFDFEVMIRVFKYITIKYTVFKRIILHLTLLQK